jgi:cytochrome bd-type quinol oxidase subunit 2
VPAVRRLSDGEVIGHYAVPVVAVAGALLLFLSAHGNVDAEHPDAAAARASYTFAILLGVAGLAGGVLLAIRNQPWAAAGAVVGIPFAFWLKDQGAKIGGYWCGRQDLSFWTVYPCDPSADIAEEMWLFALGVLALGGILAGVLAGMRRPAHAHAAFLAAGLALLVAFTLASALLIPGLDERAAAAAELALCAAAWRRVRRS